MVITPWGLHKDFHYHAMITRALHGSTSLVLITGVLAIVLFSSLSPLGTSPTTAEPKNKERTLSFDTKQQSSLIPLLLNSKSIENASAVNVKGESLSRTDAIAVSKNTSSTLLSNKYIRSFTFSTTSNGIFKSVFVSWNSQRSGRDLTYLIKESENSKYSDSDTVLYSISGKDLEVTTKSFEVDLLNEKLYLEIQELMPSGDYKVVDQSTIVAESKS